MSPSISLDRFYLSSEDVAEALLEAGFLFRSEDCDSLKFSKAAAELTKKTRQRILNELHKFEREVLK